MNRRNLFHRAAAFGAAILVPATGSRPSGPDRRDLKRAAKVLDAADSLGKGGGYDRTWSTSGCPVLVEHKGQRILGASDKGSYCCGFTFAVAVRALEAAGKLKNKSAADLRRFQKVWFGATAEEAEREKLCSLAVGELGVGKSIDADKAAAGDFAQLWRKGDKPSGHSVLFLGWVEVAGERVGLSYLSSQGSTNGIGYSVEYFAESEVGDGRVDEDRVYFARLNL